MSDKKIAKRAVKIEGLLEKIKILKAELEEIKALKLKIKAAKANTN